MPETRTKPDQFQLRFPDGMRAELKEAAKENGRSLNSEILARLSGLDTVGLRDRFAGQALVGMVTGAHSDETSMAGLMSFAEESGMSTHEIVATSSYRYADAMLAAREAR